MDEPLSMMPRTECPACGFSPLHHKSVAYHDHVTVSYVCALCSESFDVEHGYRDQAVRPKGQGGWGSDQGGGPSGERHFDQEPGTKTQIHKAAFPELSIPHRNKHLQSYYFPHMFFRTRGAEGSGEKNTLYDDHIPEHPLVRDDYTSTPGAKT